MNNFIMKKVMVLALVLVMSQVMTAQTEKGKLLFSGATGLQFLSTNLETEYDGQSQGDFDQSSFSFTPGVGYFVMDNLAVGLSANFESLTQEDLGDKYTLSSSAILPTVIYYLPLESKLRPYAQLAFGFVSAKEKETFNGSTFEAKFKGTGLSLGAGVSYFVNNTIALDFGLAYGGNNLKDADDSDLVQKSRTFGGNLGFSIFL
jgi:outer membrane protein